MEVQGGFVSVSRRQARREQIDGIASITDNGLGIWAPMSECPKKGDSQDVQRRRTTEKQEDIQCGQSDR